MGRTTVTATMENQQCGTSAGWSNAAAAPEDCHGAYGRGPSHVPGSYRWRRAEIAKPNNSIERRNWPAGAHTSIVPPNSRHNVSAVSRGLAHAIRRKKHSWQLPIDAIAVLDQ